ncbi:chromobox protein homolog 1-like [Adelges cooleyi]|uniref:chromobox protein homolog 1-like n=1 Tax=Adelges cooleyi TaxID=133065 RepID=UPI0021806523|nr:chromobox protein homolog 1-like [Adelges cooleyi]
MASTSQAGEPNATHEDISTTRRSIKAIIDKFTHKETIYYNVEWNESKNSWEPKKDIPCEMIEQYEKNPPTHTKEKDIILGYKLEEKKMTFLIRPKNETEADFFPSEIANIKYPQAVIEFYQGIIKWT